MNRYRPLARRLVPLVLLAVLAGCRSDTYRTSIDIPEGYRAEVLVLGDHPRVRLDNEGPGWIHAEIEASGYSLEPSELAAGSVMWTYPGPIRLVLTETGHGDTVVHLQIWGCEGLAIDGHLPPEAEG